METIPPEIVQLIQVFLPKITVTHVVAAYLLAQAIGRACLALRQGQGLKGILLGIWCGSNVRTAIAKDYHEELSSKKPSEPTT